MREIDRVLFKSLNRDNHKQNHYIILVDGTYDDDFYADNDADAKEIFREDYVTHN